MRKILLLVCAFSVVHCSDKDKNSAGDLNPAMRGTFTATAVAEKAMSDELCPMDTVSDMDARLVVGSSFTSIRADKEYDKSISTTQEKLLIQSIDHDKNFFVGKHEIISRGIGGWYIGKTQYQFGKSYASSKMEILQVSPNLQALFEKSKNQSNDTNTWTSCIVKDSKYQNVIENGTFTFASGKSVSAQRDMVEEKGMIECIAMKSVNDKTEELSRKEVGLGKVTRMVIHSSEVPSTGTLCPEKMAELYRKDEVVLDDGKVLTLRTEELESYR